MKNIQCGKPNICISFLLNTSMYEDEESQRVHVCLGYCIWLYSYNKFMFLCFLFQIKLLCLNWSTKKTTWDKKQRERERQTDKQKQKPLTENQLQLVQRQPKKLDVSNPPALMNCAKVCVPVFSVGCALKLRKVLPVVYWLSKLKHRGTEPYIRALKVWNGTD